MEIFGIHVCADEIMVVSAAIPVVPAIIYKVRQRFRKADKPKCECPHEEKPR